MILLGLLGALLAAGCGGALSFWMASRLLPEARIWARLAAGLCFGYWIASWGFQILGLLGAFRLPVVVPLGVGLPVALAYGCRRSLVSALARGREELAADWRRLRQALGEHRWAAAGLSLVAAHLGVRMARALATPSFGWDDFTYHLFRAGRWVQNGGLRLEPAPDAWTYYEFFPWGGDLVWAWALVWRVGDVLVPVAAIALWGAALLTAYAVARELGQDVLTALIVAMALALLPSQVSQVSTAYVDNAVLAMVLCGSLFLLILTGQGATSGSGAGRWRSAAATSFLLGASCGLGLLIKISFLPLLGVAAAIVAWLGWRSRSPAAVGAFAAGAAVALPNLLFNWLQRGSPFYPFLIFEALPYNRQWTWILGKYGEGATARELARAAKALVVNLFPLDPFLNVGWLGVLLLVLGIAGATRLLRSRRGRVYLLWVVGGALITVASFFSPANSSMVAFWTIVMGRFLVPSLAGLLVVAGLVGPTVVRRAVLPLLLVEYLWYARRKWPPEIALATLQIAALVALAVAIAVLLRRRKRSTVPGWAVMWLVVGVTLLAAIGVRERTRFDAYRLFGERRMLDFHGIPYIEAWPIWQRIEAAGASRVAATAGYDGLTGHNWFRWPLLGAWLQNEVVYLPITASGELVSYLDPGPLQAAGDRLAWLGRVRDRRIDWVVALGPATLEHRWILEQPEVFLLEISMGDQQYLLARVNHQALARHIRERGR